MHIVCTQRVDPIAKGQKILIDPEIVFVIAQEATLSIAQLHTPQTLQRRIIRVALAGPGGVVIHNKKALLIRLGNHCVNRFRAVLQIHLLAVHFLFIRQGRGVCMISFGRRPKIVRPLGDQIQMIDLRTRRMFILRVDIDLHTCEHQKIRLAQIRMIGNGVMIGQAKNLIAKCFICFLYFFRS